MIMHDVLIVGTSIASVAKRTRPSCEQDDYSQGTKIMRYSGPELPEVRHRMLKMEYLSCNKHAHSNYSSLCKGTSERRK